MTNLPNDDYDMCCGSRPHVANTCEKHAPKALKAYCIICGDTSRDDTSARLMIEWNNKQRFKSQRKTKGKV